MVQSHDNRFSHRMVEGQDRGPFSNEVRPHLVHALQQFIAFLLRIDIRWMQTDPKALDTISITSVVDPTQEIVDSFPSHQGSARHQAVEGTDLDLFEVVRSYVEQGIPVWVVSSEAAQEADR